MLQLLVQLFVKFPLFALRSRLSFLVARQLSAFADDVNRGRGDRNGREIDRVRCAGEGLEFRNELARLLAGKRDAEQIFKLTDQDLARTLDKRILLNA